MDVNDALKIIHSLPSAGDGETRETANAWPKWYLQNTKVGAHSSSSLKLAESRPELLSAVLKRVGCTSWLTLPSLGTSPLSTCLATRLRSEGMKQAIVRR